MGNKWATVEYSQLIQMQNSRDPNNPPARKESRVKSFVICRWNLNGCSIYCYFQNMLMMFSVDGEKITRNEFDFAAEMMNSFNRNNISSEWSMAIDPLL